MEKVQIEIIYEALGIKSSRLKSLEELEKYGIKVKEIKGYNNLTEENKIIFNNFILNYFNQLGMRTKLAFEAVQVNYVEEIDSISKDPDDPECELISKIIIKAIYKDGNKRVIHKYGSQYKGLKIIKTRSSKYFRFEFKEHGKKIWLHIIDQGNQWY